MSDLRDFSGYLDRVKPGWRKDYRNWRRGVSKQQRNEALREELEESLSYVRDWGATFVTAVPELRVV